MPTVTVSKLESDTTLKVVRVSELRIATSATPEIIVAELRVNSAGALPQVVVSALSIQTTAPASRYRAVGGEWVPTTRKHAVGGVWQ